MVCPPEAPWSSGKPLDAPLAVLLEGSVEREEKESWRWFAKRNDHSLTSKLPLPHTFVGNRTTPQTSQSIRHHAVDHVLLSFYPRDRVYFGTVVARSAAASWVGTHSGSQMSRSPILACNVLDSLPMTTYFQPSMHVDVLYDLLLSFCATALIQSRTG